MSNSVDELLASQLLLLSWTRTFKQGVHSNILGGLIATVPVPSHLGVKLPATLAPPALDDQQLLAIEGSIKTP